jgi:hypothetical protein
MTNLNSPQNIGSGVADYLLFAPAEHFAEIAEIIDDGVIIENDHAFKPDRGFIHINLAPFKNEITAATIGDMGSQQQDQQLKVFIPGSYAELHETIKNMNNTALIALIKDSNCSADLWYQFGNSCRFAYISANFSTGTTRDGVKGYDVLVKFINPHIQIYEGYVDLQFDDGSEYNAFFLAAKTVDFLTGTYDSLRSKYPNGISAIATIYQKVVERADSNIVSLAFANDLGETFEEVITDLDTSSLAAFLDDIYDWLVVNGNGQYVEMVGNELKFVDEAAESAYFGIAVPQDVFLGDDDTILLIDDDTILVTE